MEKTAIEKYNFWCSDSYFDEAVKAELKSIKDNAEEIEERFYTDLKFGTGGLRGILGAGTNRMNIYTVRRATQGLADFINKENGADKGVAIAYDSRKMSREFAEEAACCFCANGIKTYIFESLRPTPELSFAVRDLSCIAGVVITASHNPKEYNGYKVYWEDGAQITYPRDVEIIKMVNSIESFDMVKTTSKDNELYHVIGKEIDDKYIAALKGLILNKEAIKEQSDIKIVYTPLHGTGNIPVRRILKEAGFKNVFTVPGQEMPDGSFPTVKYPNPENREAFNLALDFAEKMDADIILATDPDADRLGVFAKDAETGDYVQFSGNMSGLLLCEYELSQKRAQHKLPDNGAVVTTIVSGKMAQCIAEEYGVALIETLTGFKYIGEQIKFFEENHEHEFLFGFEESYGCLIGTHARDKDAVAAAMAICEAAAYYKSRNLTLCGQMENLYKKYGYFKEELYTVTLQGLEGIKKIGFIMESIRKNPPKEIAGYRVTNFYDYKAGKKMDCLTGAVTPTCLPISDVLYFEEEGGTWCCIRPSGTEAKIKVYAGIRRNSAAEAEKALAEFKMEVIKLLED